MELEYAAIEDRRVRNQLRNAGDLEVQVTALQVAALKRLSPGSKVLLMDRNGGGPARAVAKELAARGFGRVFVIKGGFNGWVSRGGGGGSCWDHRGSEGSHGWAGRGWEGLHACMPGGGVM